MGKHNFREFFFLAAPENPKANKKAVCWSCIQKHTLPVALTNSDCFVSNKAKLCRSHLKKCLNFEQEYNEEERKEILLHNNSIINFTNNPSTSTAIKQTTLNNFISRPLSNKDIPHFENLVLLMIVSNGLPFTFLENKETQDVFKFIAPALKLPGRKAISDRILPDSASQLKKSILEVASNDKIGVIAAFDGWTNIKQEHLFGVIFITSKGETLIWGAHDISDQRSRTEDAKLLIKDIMDDAEKNGIQVNCYVSDSAGEYAAARRQLRVEYPSKVFIPCMAHQMNLVVGDIFKESESYKVVSKNAVRIVSYFHSSPYFTGLLRNEQKSIYNQTISLITPGETRWNSFYFCFNSVLKTEAALKTLVTKFSPERVGTVSNSRSGFSRQRFSSGNNNTNKVIYPDVIAIWEQPLLLLSFVLHPKYRLSKFTSNISNLSYTYFGQWLGYYYQVWFGEIPKSILREYLTYQREIFPFDSNTYNQFNENIVDFWESAKGLAPELSQLALHLFGICVNSASVERLWSSMGFLHTKCRNRLHHQKVLAMSQLRSDILKMRKREEIDNTEKQYKRIHIAASVQPYNDEEEVDKEAEEETETQINISDCEEEADTEISIEDNNTSEILSADHWLRMVENWVKMLDIENHLDNGENVNEEPIEFELGGRDIHPADDPLAKWDLLFLFNDSLEAPVYLSSLTNF
ncbi:unnamed protein product [Rhizophagus irregularis]|nr:unnamed protein product [Rhizophagus irregularis]